MVEHKIQASLNINEGEIRETGADKRELVHDVGRWLDVEARKICEYAACGIDIAIKPEDDAEAPNQTADFTIACSCPIGTSACKDVVVRAIDSAAKELTGNPLQTAKQDSQRNLRFPLLSKVMQIFL